MIFELYDYFTDGAQLTNSTRKSSSRTIVYAFRKNTKEADMRVIEHVQLTVDDTC